MHRALATLLGLAAACTDRPVDEDTDAGTTSTSTTASTTTVEAPTTGTSDDEDSGTSEPIEPCLEVQYSHQDPPAWMLTCGLPELYAGDGPLVFEMAASDGLDPPDVTVDDLERARCMIAALRDRTPGQIAWWQVTGMEVIWAPLSLEITGDTALVRNVAGLSDGLSENVYEGISPLRPPEFFADCAEGDALAVWLCLIDAAEHTCLPGPLTCPK